MIPHPNSYNINVYRTFFFFFFLQRDILTYLFSQQNKLNISGYKSGKEENPIATQFYRWILLYQIHKIKYKLKHTQVAKIFRDAHACSHTFMHIHSRRKPDGQTDAKKIFRSVDIIQSHKHKLVQYTHMDMHIHAHPHPPFKD